MNRRQLLLTMPGLVAAQTRVPMMAPPERMPAPPSQGHEAILPMHPGIAAPSLEVKINDAAPAWFALDTGAMAYGAVSAEAAEAWKLPVVGKVLMGDPSGMNPREARIFRARKLQVGGIVFRDVDLAETVGLEGAPQRSERGVLGLDLLQGFVVTLDAVKQQSQWRRGQSLPAANGKNVFQSGPGPFLRVDLQIGAVGFAADVDTGQSRAALIVPANQVPRLATRGEAASIGFAQTMSQRIAMQSIELAAKVMAGSVALDITHVAFPSPVPVANLGWQGFKGRRLAIDADQRRLQID